MEIGFKSPVEDFDMGAIMQMFRNNGVDGFTVARDARGRAIGIRTQYVPEFAGDTVAAQIEVNAERWINNAKKSFAEIDQAQLSYAEDGFVDTLVIQKGDYGKHRSD